MSKTLTRTKGEAGPIESNIGPPTPLNSNAERPRKKVSRIVMAPLTSPGKFFINSDSRPITSTVEVASMRELRIKAIGLSGSSTNLKLKQTPERSKNAGAI